METAFSSPVPGESVCPSCGHRLRCYDPVQSTHFGCPVCGAFYVDATEEEVKVLRVFRGTDVTEPLIAIGTSGRLLDKDYTVTGFLLKQESVASDRWQEYLLNSPDGNAVLSVYAGHWMLVPAAPLPQAEVVSASMGTAVAYKGDLYYKWNRYGLKLLYARGEFDWNALEDEALKVTEYAGKGRMILDEQTGQHQYYEGIYIRPSQVKSAFGGGIARLPRRWGVGAIQPNPYRQIAGRLRWIAGAFVLLVALTQLLLAQYHPGAVVFSDQYTPASDSLSVSRPIVSRSFALQHKSALWVRFVSNVSNSWVDVEAVLVNERSGQQFEFSKAIEVYSGVEGGEYWSEGTGDEESVLSGVPAGTYHLVITPAVESGHSETLFVEASTSSWITSNFMLTMLVAVGVVAGNAALSNHFEKRRRGD